MCSIQEEKRAAVFTYFSVCIPIVLMVIRVDVTSINEMKSTPSAEMRSLAGERFHVSKVDEDRPTQSSVKGCRQGKHATK